MSSTAGNYDIEFPKIAVVRFHSRRTAAVITAAATVAAALGVICCATLLAVAVTTASQRARHSGADSSQSTADRSSSVPPEQDHPVGAVYVDITRDLSEDAHAARLQTCPGENPCSQLFYNTEGGRLDIRVSAGPEVVVQVRQE